MTGKNFIYTLMTSFVLVLGACTSEDVSDSFDRTADGTIDFNVGVEASPANRTMTRSLVDETALSGDGYYAMQANTQVRLRVDGTWSGKPNPNISQAATYKTIAEDETKAKHVNALSFDSDTKLYWDDYGTGDPENKNESDKLYKEIGLNVYGVSVDGETSAPDPSDWQALEWSTVDNDGKTEINTTTHLLKKDILVSNNLTGNDAYKFADRNTLPQNLLSFKHVLSKITINLTANNGFQTEGGVGKTEHRFYSDPVLTLTNATTVAGAENNGGAYALTEGAINIEKAEANADDANTKKNIIAGTINTEGKPVTVVKEALVYPGTLLGATDDNDVIAQLNADGNIYYIKAAEIRAAMADKTPGADYKTLPGYNYIINVTVNKSEIIVTSTVTNWVTVNSTEVAPEINVTVGIGENAEGAHPTDFTAFNFYRSETKANGYGTEPAATPTGTPDGKTKWDFGTKKLFWPNHEKHYHFRGIFPTITSLDEDAAGNQVVKVTNGKYDAEKFPCNFLMGMPIFPADKKCDNPDHTPVNMNESGICARTEAINLTFNYMMSRVEVILYSSNPSDDNYVDLSNIEVELTNVYDAGNILLKDRSAEVTGDAGNYTLSVSDAAIHEYKDIIVPQALTFTSAGAAGNVRFKITVTNKDNTKDIYYADVAPIMNESKTAKVAPLGKWESGTRYVYKLKVTKTEIKATATLEDWVTVEGSQEVWF